MSVSAAVHYYEPFSYPEGENALPGHGGYFAFVSGATTFASGDIAEGNLQYTDALGNTLRSLGNHAVIDTAEEGRRVDNRVGLNLSQVTGNVLWFSLVGRQIAGTGARFFNAGFYVPDNTVEPPDAGTALDEAFSIGMPSGQYPEQRWRVSSRATGTTGWSSAISGTSTLEPAFLVVRVELNFEGSDLERYTIWVNPILNTAPLEDNGFSVTSSYSDFAAWTDLSYLRLAAGESTAGNPASSWILDEIRIADTWQEVMPYDPPFRITSIEPISAAGGCRLKWTASPGRLDVVEWSTDLVAWQPYPQSASLGTALTEFHTWNAPPPPPGAAAFYLRVNRTL
jgi:hypothetical protein